MGMWDLDKLDDADRGFCSDASKKTGARFVVSQAVFPDSVTYQGGKSSLPMTFSLKNSGSACVHECVVFKFELFIKDKLIAEQSLIPPFPLSEILPDTGKEFRLVLELPPGLQKNEVTVRLKLENLESGSMDLANEKYDPEPGLTIGHTLLSATSDLRKIIHSVADLSLPNAGSAAQGVSSSVSSSIWSLKGTSSDGWNYWGSNPFPIKAGVNYALRVKVRARKTDIQDSKLFFKFGIHGKDMKWIRNVNTAQYDFSHPDTVQELSVFFSARDNGENFFLLAVEKGQTAPASIDADILEWNIEESAIP